MFNNYNKSIIMSGKFVFQKENKKMVFERENKITMKWNEQIIY